MMKAYAIPFAAAVAFMAASPALATTPDYMRDKCRAYVASHLHVDPGKVNVKYEGQRVDKTHAVNGSTEGAHPVTFQCNFAANGKRVTHFVVNAPEGCPADVSQADRYKYPDCD